ncbi:glycoside hydrolase family 88/105 protein [Autumnicola musiva]|uniref:Glycoside hydrolase family 88 protein n=1 Tax=Autumnicola musiva TaxID=3075589 RepID=A0ABU3D7Y9_9FLAO|nr:glycoside hydrolase family 88 protein [Zunongwangia sp. F117]MDT0677647.1 glycoside hydrolase family 88 protein [Zunongwangia sp. F117]
MKFSSKVICILLNIFIIISCKNNKNNDVASREQGAEQELLISKDMDWSVRMMLSEIERFPEASKLDFVDQARWSYTNGLVLNACEGVYKKTGRDIFYEYIYAYANALVEEDGTIKTYNKEKYNLDMIKSGDNLLYLYNETGEERFRLASNKLMEQLKEQPRTPEGGFWHKKRYTQQMWLDGLYMAEPFYAHYTSIFSDSLNNVEENYEDIIHQFELIQKHALDEETGLLYHGWDSSKQQKWADNETGTSPNFWSRAMGWYSMALVDVLDYLPENHPEREKLVTYLNDLGEALLKYQDKETGLWYQVVDQGDRQDNYLEASGSSMFTYAFAKGYNQGYLPQKFEDAAQKAYEGILNNLITVEESGIVNLNQVCAVAGLGGDPYRDGSYDYYVNEKIRSNDPKGTGPFILASLALDR